MGRDDEAKEVVYRLHGSSDENRAEAEKEYSEMYATIKAEAAVRSRNIRDLWASKAMIHRTLVACGVQVFCQFTGINGESDYKHTPDNELREVISDQLLRASDV